MSGKNYLKLYQQTVRNEAIAMVGTTVTSIVVFLMLEDLVPRVLLLGWLLMQGIFLIIRFRVGAGLRHTEINPTRREASLRRFAPVMFLTGAGWGCASILAAAYGTILEQTLVLAIILGIIGAAIGTIARYFRAYIALLLGAMAPQITTMLASGNGKEMMLALLGIIYCVIVYLAGKLVATHINNLEEVKEHLSTAKKAADEANQAKSRFLSSISHEFRTPLNAIIGFSHVLEWQFDEAPPKELRSSLEHILQAGQHLLTLVEDIFDIVKIEQNKIDIPLEDIDLQSAIETSLSLVQNQADAANIALKYQATEHRVTANSKRLAQVLVNLLSNGIKYNKSGGQVTIEVATASQGKLEIRVSDTGVGITPEEAENIFAPFSRLTYARRNAIEGTGIGLTLAKFLIERMNGSIGIKHKVPPGATFWIRLPQASATSHIDHTEKNNGVASTGAAVGH